jgi:hypothetical protein
MIRTRRAKALVVGVVIAALSFGGAVAARSASLIQVHARLAPVTGTVTPGRLTGALTGRSGHMTPFGTGTSPASHWQLTWRLNRPALKGRVTTSLRIGAFGGYPRVTLVLCTRCSAQATGTVALTSSEAMRVARTKAVVIVRTHTVRLRGPLKAALQLPVPTG